MRTVSLILIALIAALHLYIAYFEIFAWTTRGPNVFPDFPKNLFEPTQTLALNQGTYNAFLAAGLIWSLLIRDRHWHANVATCFLFFVAVAGLVGGLSASPRIFLVQLLPAIIALVCVYVARRKYHSDAE